MKFVGYFTRAGYALSGDIELTFSTTDKKVVESIKADKKLNIEVKEYRESRSLNANAYMWTLLKQLAKDPSLKTTAIDLYRKYVHEFGVFKDFDMSQEVAKTFIHLWKEKGIAWLIDKVDEDGDIVTLRGYYGSSVYNTKQMARLLDAIVEDCKKQGVETLDENELKSLVERYNK